jgi:hypothetical protein
MPATSAKAYLRDPPDAELHLLDGAGHWLLETHFEQALPLISLFWAGFVPLNNSRHILRR